MKSLRWLSLVIAVCVLAVGLVSLVSSPDALAAQKRRCCNPALEPGTGGNPFCFEGHTCCANGTWQCNNANGSPSCPPGVVCP